MYKTIAVLLITSVHSATSAQTFPIETDNMEATGFYSVHGVVTSDHVTEFPATNRYTERDVRIDRRTKTKYGLRFGNGTPSHFYDRRHHRISVTVHSERKFYWTIDQRFYAGESGTPIFDSQGAVVGVASGNDRSEAGQNPWLGRVSKFGIAESRSGFPSTPDRKQSGVEKALYFERIRERLER